MANPIIELRVPDIGNYKDVEVIDVMVKAGDSVEIDTGLITLETEKATMDVPSTAAGTVREVKLQQGSRVSQGDVIALVEPSSSAAASSGEITSPASAAEVAPAGEGKQKPAPRPAAAKPAAAAETKPSRQPAPAKPGAAEEGSTSPAKAAEVAGSAGEGRQTPPPPPSPAKTAERAGIDEPGFSRAHASPSIRKLARELGVDLARVGGRGPKGRITDDDVKAWVKRALSSAGATSGASTGASAWPRIPAVDFAAFGAIERKPLSRIQKIAGPRLHASWVNLPHVTQFDEADITDMEITRAALKGQATERGIKLTPLAFVLRACVQALQQFPQFCTSLDLEAGELVYKKYVHLGFAADTPNGLVVPVVRDADRKDVFELARDLGELSEKARAGKLSAADMQGGCFTVSSLGGIGGTAFTPIINAPEVAILGVSRSAYKPVYRDGGFVPRLLLPLSLSYDHRVIDGAAAVRFTSFLASALANIEGLMRAIP